MLFKIQPQFPLFVTHSTNVCVVCCCNVKHNHTYSQLASLAQTTKRKNAYNSCFRDLFCCCFKKGFLFHNIW